jgi:hypothetical protein
MIGVCATRGAGSMVCQNSRTSGDLVLTEGTLSFPHTPSPFQDDNHNSEDKEPTAEEWDAFREFKRLKKKEKVGGPAPAKNIKNSFFFLRGNATQPDGTDVP